MAIRKYTFPLEEKYDLIIVSPIYTQLLFQQGLSNINILHNLNYPENLLNHIQNKLLDLMPTVINRFNQNIRSSLTEKASVIVISDIFEAHNNSIFYENTKGLKNIESIYKEYLSTYGIGIGDYGLINMSESLEENTSQWFEWPFNENKTLFVKAVVYKN